MNTDKLLKQYFQKEQRKEDSLRLQERIAKQTYRKSRFNWQRLVIPAAATVLLIIGFSVWKSTQQKEHLQLAQKEIIYEDEDLMIYLKKTVAERSRSISE